MTPPDALAAAAGLPPTLPAALATPADDGRPDADLEAALLRWSASTPEQETAVRAEVVRVFRAARVYLPAVTVEGGRLGLVALRRSDGLTAVPVFTGVERLLAWRADARPLPHPGSTVATIAQEEGYAVAVLDIDGPVTATLPTADLADLAGSDGGR